MKKIAYILIATIAFGACTKDRLMYNEAQYDAVNLSASLLQTTATLGLLAGEVALSDLDTGTVRGIPFSRIAENGTSAYTLYFGDTTDTDFDGRKRSGTVHVRGKLNFPTSPDTLEIELNSFVENGIRYTGAISNVESGASTFVKNMSSSNLQVKTGDRTVNFNFTHTMQVLSQVNLLLQSSLTAIATGDQEFKVTPVENLFYYTDTYCFEKGKMNVITPNDSIFINFGNGELDGLATATSEEFRYILKLTDF
jgi:hypothetical protein